MDDAEKRMRTGLLALYLEVAPSIVEDMTTRVDAALREAEERATKAERERCAYDVCMYCGKRALGYEPAEGPNQAGNWTHTNKAQGRISIVMCLATGIHSRARYYDAIEATGQEGE